MFLNYSKTHNPGLLLPHYLYWEHLPRTGFRLEDFGFLDYLEYWISSFRILYKFQLSGLFGILDFVFPGFLFCLPGFFISDSWIIWDIGFRLPGLFGILVCGVGLL
ncbi:unnamed protein product [Rhizophagus irregularis]|nr:unnamed protein product [Rhizophagus irregularis]